MLETTGSNRQSSGIKNKASRLDVDADVEYSVGLDSGCYEISRLVQTNAQATDMYPIFCSQPLRTCHPGLHLVCLCLFDSKNFILDR
jgi:hypothetical protein